LQSNPFSSTDWSTSSLDFEHTEEQKVVWGSWRWSYREAVNLPWPYWRALLVFTVLKVARFSEAFVTLHANAVGLKAAYLPMLMVATNLIQSLLTYPLGVVADRVDQNGVYGNGRKFMLLGGFGMMIVADFVLVLAKTPWQVFVGYLAVGVHMAMTQANMKAVLSATMPPNVRGTGFAISALSQGIALGAGNYMAGRLCDLFGSSGAFWGGGAFATAALGLGWLLL
jgi:MFS-type transporter involved in bile tolerance (Atg22 family)